MLQYKGKVRIHFPKEITEGTKKYPIAYNVLMKEARIYAEDRATAYKLIKPALEMAAAMKKPSEGRL